MNEKISLKFEKVEASNIHDAHHSDGCSGDRSDCCTRVCTRAELNPSEGSLNDWDEYLDVNAGVIQY